MFARWILEGMLETTDEAAALSEPAVDEVTPEGATESPPQEGEKSP